MNELHLVKPFTVRITKSIALLLSLCFCLNLQAALTPNSVTAAKFDPFKISPKDIEKVTGKKLTLIEKIKLKLAQRIVKRYSDGEMTARQKKQARISMILGILGLAFLFISLSPFLGFLGILSIPSAILAIVVGSRSLKGNSNSEGIIGVVSGGVTVALIIIAVIAIAVAFSGFTFE